MTDDSQRYAAIGRVCWDMLSGLKYNSFLQYSLCPWQGNVCTHQTEPRGRGSVQWERTAQHMQGPELYLQYQEIKETGKAETRHKSTFKTPALRRLREEQVWGQPKLHADFEAILSYAIRSFLSAKTNKIETWQAKMAQFFCILTHLFYLFNQEN